MATTVGRDIRMQHLINSLLGQSKTETALFNQIENGSQALKVWSISFFPAMICSSQYAIGIGSSRSINVQVSVIPNSVQKFLDLCDSGLLPLRMRPPGNLLPSLRSKLARAKIAVVDLADISLVDIQQFSEFNLRHLFHHHLSLLDCKTHYVLFINHY